MGKPKSIKNKNRKNNSKNAIKNKLHSEHQKICKICLRSKLLCLCKEYS